MPFNLNSNPLPLDNVASKSIPSPAQIVLFVTVFDVEVFVRVTVSDGEEPSPTVMIISLDGVAVQLSEFRVFIVNLLK